MMHFDDLEPLSDQEIRFENGSKIRQINSHKNNERSRIRGRRLTDEEYTELMESEYLTAEEKLSRAMEIMGLK